MNGPRSTDNGGAGRGPEHAGPAWREAERQLRRHFQSFGLGEPRQLDRLIDDSLARVPLDRANDAIATVALAGAEARVAAWFARVLGRRAGDPADALLAGRATFLLCDGPTRWPDAFLSDPPPPAFVEAMRGAAVEPTPPPEPSTMPVQELACWSFAELLRLVPPRVRAAYAALAPPLSRRADRKWFPR